MSQSILAVGSIAFDTIKTPSGLAEKALGGSVNYFSIAASFYSPVQVLGVVGEDFPKDHLDWLKKRNVDTSGVQMVPGKTFHWSGSYDGNLNEAKTHATDLNVFEKFDPRLSAQHKTATYVFLANIDPVLQTSVLDQVAAPKLIALDSMNFWITGKLDELKKVLKRVDILSINEGEAYLLSGERNITSAVAAIKKMGPSVVIVKRGEYGAMLFSEKGLFLAPAFPVSQVKDPTGAGDSFAGAFMGYLAKHGASREMAKADPAKWNSLLRQAVLAGCVMASFTVEDFSFQRLARLEAQELTNRQNALLEMIQV
jgi:sugar/nucleoside kinase (ribokinase family)